ncbi:MAG: N-acetylglucosamine-6-phosphate deacetylase [Chloroflexota bacterium]
MMLFIKHAHVLTPNDVLEDGAVLVENGRLTAVAPSHTLTPPPNARIIDATGQYLIPGLIDLQLNGGFGHDFTQDPGTIWEVARQLPRHGVTSFLPTIITAPLSVSQRGLDMLAQGPPADFVGAAPLGLHIEGPFLNPAKKGAHNPAYIQPPNLAAASHWSAANGVALVTLAPEMPGALPLVEALAGRGVVVSAGHSMATLAEAQAGFEAGIRYGTHLFNAMPPLHHREPGLAGALLTDERLTVGLIPDGIHVHPALVKMVWEGVSRERLNFVTDAMGALGMPPGRYLLGDHEVHVSETMAQLADGTLAGSIISLDVALRHAIAYTESSLTAVLPTFTSVPARLLGLDHQLGYLRPGYIANMVLLSSTYYVNSTIINGIVIEYLNATI